MILYKTHLVKPVKIQMSRRSSKILGLQKYRCAGSVVLSTLMTPKKWQFLVLASTFHYSVTVNFFLPPSPPLLSFTIYNGGVSSVAEERLSSVRLTPSSSLLKQFDYITKQCLSLPLTDALLSMRSCNKICNCRAFNPFRK